MTSIKLKFRPSRVEGNTGTLYFQVIHQRVCRQVATGYRLYPSEWKAGRVLLPAPSAPRYHYLLTAREALRKESERLCALVSQLEHTSPSFTSAQLLEAYKGQDHDMAMLGTFASAVVSHLKLTGKSRLAETYASAVSSFLHFRAERGDVRMEGIDETMLRDYESYLLRERRLELNTVSFYMRNLRAIYNRAVSQGLVTANPQLFKQVYTGVGKTVKRAVSPEVIRHVKQLDLRSSPMLERSRDYFLLCFYLRGISFVDLAYLKQSDLRGDYLRYHRQKTRQRLTIKWESQMQEIVLRYHAEGSPYLLPIIREPGVDERRQYLNALHRVNAHLRVIGRMVGCPVKLTTYCARHAWATIAHNMNVPLAVISQAMGHESERTTRIYLASLDEALIDDANQKIINAL